MNKITKKWQTFGFLDGLDDSAKKHVAANFEAVAQYLLKTPNGKYQNQLEILAFPIVRKVTTKTQYNIEPKHFVSKLRNDLEAIQDLHVSHVDVEAEFCGHFANNYVEFLNSIQGKYPTNF